MTLRKRKRVYRLCVLAGLAGGTSLVGAIYMWLIPGYLIPALILGVLAPPASVLGLFLLKRVGMGPPVIRSTPGPERLASRLTRSALAGLACATASLLLCGFKGARVVREVQERIARREETDRAVREARFDEAEVVRQVAEHTLEDLGEER